MELTVFEDGAISCVSRAINKGVGSNEMVSYKLGEG